MRWRRMQAGALPAVTDLALEVVPKMRTVGPLPSTYETALHSVLGPGSNFKAGLEVTYSRDDLQSRKNAEI